LYRTGNDANGFRQLSDSFELKANVTGFKLVSLQARNHHWPSLNNEDGAKQDFINRNPLTNVDVIFADQMIDALVASGEVDPNYIFVSGWSNGKFVC
jgi:poly(3-hydroxybutyrate) depolymerase